MSVAQAQDFARTLVQRESRGNGDLVPAMKRLERRHALPKGLLHSLRYRPPKTIALDVWQSLLTAYQAECLRQVQQLEHEITVTRKLVHDLDPNFIDEAERLAAKVRSAPKR